jgi:hypothetical protein
MKRHAEARLACSQRCISPATLGTAVLPLLRKLPSVHRAHKSVGILGTRRGLLPKTGAIVLFLNAHQGGSVINPFIYALLRRDRTMSLKESSARGSSRSLNTVIQKERALRGCLHQEPPYITQVNNLLDWGKILKATFGSSCLLASDADEIPNSLLARRARLLIRNKMKVK